MEKEIRDILETGRQNTDRSKALKTILGILDLTTLEGADNTAKIGALCRKAVSFRDQGKDLPNVAAVCVYPTLVRTARGFLTNSDVKVASVAGAFPAGQSPLTIKVAEVRYAIEQGAEEIDMVISRGKFLEGKKEEVASEISAIKCACDSVHLKVILETGELLTPENIKEASGLAMGAGADFIKTSTGKISPGATLEAVYIMCQSIRDHYEKTGKMIGIKPAGGISDPDVVLDYFLLVKHLLGESWLNKNYFRIGASRLADHILAELLT